MLNWFITLIEENNKKPFTPAELEYIADLLPTTTHPQRFMDARLVIQQMRADFKRDNKTIA